VIPGDSQETRVLFHEDFEDLSGWEPFHFLEIREHTLYAVEKNDGSSFLKTSSSNSASAILHRKKFNIFRFSRLRWRWLIKNIYRKGNAEKKPGYDYPAKIYVTFQYDPEKAGFRDKIRYESARLIYRAYPPYASLNYIWANRTQSKRIIENS